jgi:hypothetical protein
VDCPHRQACMLLYKAERDLDRTGVEIGAT